MIGTIIAAVIIALAITFGILYRKKVNKKADESQCPACHRFFRSEDITSENLCGDGLSNGKTRKIEVTMQCSYCKERKVLTIYTQYRHHPSKGSPARQYFKDLEARRAQETQNNQ